ncbi:MAG: hypothetical protein AB7V46_19185, partial [Thermomicrobiales bacterium]
RASRSNRRRHSSRSEDTLGLLVQWHRHARTGDPAVERILVDVEDTDATEPSAKCAGFRTTAIACGRYPVVRGVV